MTKKEIHDAAALYRDMNFAALFSVWLELAAQTNPEAIRKSLATVFDVSKFEEAAKRALVILTDAQECAHEAASDLRELTNAIGLELDSMEKRMDALRYELERLNEATVRKPAASNGTQAAQQPARRA